MAIETTCWESRVGINHGAPLLGLGLGFVMSLNEFGDYVLVEREHGHHHIDLRLHIVSKKMQQLLLASNFAMPNLAFA